MKYYDTMGFESEHGVYVRRADADSLAAELETVKARAALRNADLAAELATLREWQHKRTRITGQVIDETRELEARVQALEAEAMDHALSLKIIEGNNAKNERVAALEAENARLNMEMAAYREKLTPQDAAAMKAVMDALYAEKQSRAALASPPPASAAQGWQPIETAPKDQTDVLVWLTGNREGQFNERAMVCRYATPWAAWCLPGIGGLKASHWMPLPAAPTSETKP